VDNDGDGLPASLDPDDNNPDIDGDGYQDGYEATQGSDIEDPKSAPLLGDVNLDGYTNNLDAVMLFNYAIGRIDTLVGLKNADTRADGQLNNVDATVLFNFAIGRISKIPM
jgi:hypothetical protein